MMISRFVAFVLIFAAMAQADGQERTMNPGAGGALRVWPESGNWAVALIRNVEGKLACATLTGKRNEHTGEFYLWGLRRQGQGWSVVISDRNENAVVGNDIHLVIDGTEIGDFTVVKRSEKGGMSSIRADVPDNQVGKLSRLLPIGGEIKLVTSSATYSATLEGMSVALFHTTQCLTEAEQMESPQQ